MCFDIISPKQPQALKISPKKSSQKHQFTADGIFKALVLKMAFRENNNYNAVGVRQTKNKVIIAFYGG